MSEVTEYPLPMTLRRAELLLEMAGDFCGNCLLVSCDECYTYCALFKDELMYLNTGILRGYFPVYRNAYKVEPHTWWSYKRCAKCVERFK